MYFSAQNTAKRLLCKSQHPSCLFRHMSSDHRNLSLALYHHGSVLSVCDSLYSTQPSVISFLAEHILIKQLPKAFGSVKPNMGKTLPTHDPELKIPQKSEAAACWLRYSMWDVAKYKLNKKKGKKKKISFSIQGFHCTVTSLLFWD